MANRMFQQFGLAMEKRLVTLGIKFTGGGAGSNVVLDAANSKGVKSISRTADGDHTITLQDNYVKLVDLSMAVTSTGTPTTWGYFVKAITMNASGGATIRVGFFGATPGTLVAIATADTWQGTITLGDSTAPYG